MFCPKCHVELRVRAKNGQIEQFCANRFCAKFRTVFATSPIKTASEPETDDDNTQEEGKNPEQSKEDV